MPNRTDGAVVVYFSDGDRDSPNDDLLLEVAAKRICKNDQVIGVAIIGISAENRARMRDVFASMGERLVLVGRNDTNLDALQTLLNVPRIQKGAKR